MSTKRLSILTATFVLPLLLVACDRSEQSPTASRDSARDKGQAMAPAPNDMMKDAPPAAGNPVTPAPNSQAPAPDPSAAPSVGDNPPPDVPGGKKGNEN